MIALRAAGTLGAQKGVGSFSFEFMGSRAVVCGYESQTLPSVLERQPCVGLGGGVVYFSRAFKDLCRRTCGAQIIWMTATWPWLDAGLDDFAYRRPRLRQGLSVANTGKNRTSAV